MYRKEQPQVQIGFYVPWEKHTGEAVFEKEDQLVQTSKAVRSVCCFAALFSLHTLASWKSQIIYPESVFT
jgi:hypothetical protein